MRQLDRSLKTTIIVFLGLIALTIALTPNRVTWDVALYLNAGERILDGQTPYIDFYEINFPMIYYLNVMVIFISRLTGIHELITVMWMTWAILVTVVLTTYRLSNDYFDDASIGRYIVPLGISLFGYYAIHANTVFAQREMLFMLFFLPGFLLRINRWHGKAQTSAISAFTIGFIAAIGVNIKPFFLLIPFFFEIYSWLFFRHRRRTALLAPEVWGFFVSCLFYGLYFILQPDLTASMLDMLGLVREGYGGYIYYPFTLMIQEVVFVLALCASLAGFLISERGYQKLWGYARPFALLTLIGWLIYLVQMRGLAYQRTPFELGLTVLLLFFVVRLANYSITSGNETSLQTNLATGLVSLMLFGIIHTLGVIPSLQVQLTPLQQTVMQYTDEGDPILSIDPYVHVGLNYPDMQMINRRFIGRYIHMFPYLMSFPDDEIEEILDPNRPIPERVADLMEHMSEDITRENPKLILIDKTARGLYHYLILHGFIRETVEPNYTLVEETEKYVVYARQDIIR